MMHVIGEGTNQVIILDEVSPPVYYYVRHGILAIPGKYSILPVFRDSNIVIGSKLDHEWGWTRIRERGINMHNYRGWYLYHNDPLTSFEYGIKILNIVKNVYLRNMAR